MIKLGSLISDGVVFQAGKEPVIFGQTEKFKQVRVTLYCGTERIEERDTSSDELGSFEVRLSARPAGFDTYHLITESGEDKVIVNDRPRLPHRRTKLTVVYFYFFICFIWIFCPFFIAQINGGDRNTDEEKQQINSG